MAKYANQTTVPIDRSRQEIMSILDKYGCDGIATTQSQQGWAVEFFVHDRRVRFVLIHPQFDEFAVSKGQKKRNKQQQESAWNQALRQRYRALALAIKAKLEIVESEISCFEHEFMANIVDPVTNEIMGNLITPKIEERYQGVDTRRDLRLPGPTT